MGILSRRRKEPQPAVRSVVAAAQPMAGPGVRRAQSARAPQTTEAWQKEAWYHFDAIGEVRGPLVWIANAVSQADVHATDIDPDTGKPTGPSDDARAQAIASQVLGGPAKRASLLKVAALCWQVAGEVWIIVRPTPARAGVPQPDEWLVLASSRVKPKGSGADIRWTYRSPLTGADVELEPEARLFRVWSPHPEDPIKADSAMRPALPICREIEKSSQNIVARLDSRLAVAGILFLAEELEFPLGDHDTTTAAILDVLLEAAETGIRQPGTAAGVVPIGVTAPGELIASGGMAKLVDFATEMNAQVLELRQDALRRLAATLDMPKDVAEGTQGESNHWSAWQVEESTYKIFIEPLLQAIGDGLTTEWYRPALIAAGVTDTAGAERKELGWDTTAIVARPDDRETLESAYDKVLISDDYWLAESGLPEDAKPDPEERTRRLLEKWVSGAPTLLADPAVAAALGIEVTVDPAAAGVAGAGAGEIEGSQAPDTVRSLPTRQAQEPEADAVPEGLVAAAEVLVRQALDRAGGRLLTNQNRGQFKGTPRHELYMHIRPTSLDGMVEVRFADGVAEAFGIRPARLHQTLTKYNEACLATGRPFSVADLHVALEGLR